MPNRKKQSKRKFDLSEHTEGQLLGDLARLAREIGEDKFIDMAMDIILPWEEEMREKGQFSRDSLEMLDEYHAEQAYKERGFE